MACEEEDGPDADRAGRKGACAAWAARLEEVRGIPSRFARTDEGAAASFEGRAVVFGAE